MRSYYVIRVRFHCIRNAKRALQLQGELFACSRLNISAVLSIAPPKRSSRDGCTVLSVDKTMMQFVFSLEENTDECQFYLSEVI